MEGIYSIDIVQGNKIIPYSKSLSLDIAYKISEGIIYDEDPQVAGLELGKYEVVISQGNTKLWKEESILEN